MRLRVLFALLSSTAFATAPMPMNSSFLRQYAKTRRFLSGRPVMPQFLADPQQMLFLRSPPDSPVQTLFRLDAKTGKTVEVLTPESLLQGAQQTLTAEEKARLERLRVSARGFTSYRLSKDKSRVAVSLSGKLYVVDLASGKSQALKTGNGAAVDPRFSPNGKHLAYVRETDVFAVDLKTGKERRLTRGGSELKTHGLAEFVAQEEMSRHQGFWWSGDSKFIAYQEADLTEVEQLRVQDAFHPEKAPDAFAYPRAGKQNARVRLGIVSAEGGSTVWARWDAEKYPYLATVKWPRNGELTLVVQDRRQREEQVLAVNPKTGATRMLLTEKDEAWLNLDQEFPRWLEDGSGFLWYTERNGAAEVELRAKDGSLSRSWVPPSAHFVAFAGVDEKAGQLYFTANPEVIRTQLFRAQPGKPPERVTLEGLSPGWVEAELSEDGQALRISHTSVAAMPRTYLYSVDGKRLAELPSVADEPDVALKVEFRKVKVAEELHAAIFRPRTQKPGQKLPVILSVYGGPSSSTVRDVMREHLLSQWYADLGFIVVKVDNRGTPNRHRSFEKAIVDDFSKVILDDQVAALHALGKELPELDLTRVGIEGWSFGGYLSALAVLKRPDVFRVAVAGAPVVDWTDYDTHYTERYLGLPQQNVEGYKNSSLLTYADKLARPLLLIHGTADDNVYFLHTLKLSDALFRAGKPHGVLPLSGLTHMVPDPLYTERLYERVAQYLADGLQ